MTDATVFTIGFTQTTASHFFERLLNAGTKKVIDVRLNNSSQLAAFAKAKDLAYFLKKIGSIEYLHMPLLAPTQSILTAFKKEKGDWNVYQGRFLSLMAERQIETKFTPQMFDGACLLCSEATPHYCHRRLVCEYLNQKWHNSLEVRHL
jgi:uncharacterized protein (DUF488 family)